MASALTVESLGELLSQVSLAQCWGQGSFPLWTIKRDPSHPFFFSFVKAGYLFSVFIKEPSMETCRHPERPLQLTREDVPGGDYFFLLNAEGDHTDDVWSDKISQEKTLVYKSNLKEGQTFISSVFAIPLCYPALPRSAVRTKDLGLKLQKKFVYLYIFGQVWYKPLKM